MPSVEYLRRRRGEWLLQLASWREPAFLTWSTANRR
ncbi:hypothetical protein PC128_g16611 [Phytophthora cactorum]|uniref:Uncharacterized protein n=1 Tax=Phytophthora cactorum TaxID=29920 RepID=A0A8T1A5A8_9STRA|nr:hypothetical protein PC117_g27934 [Phytophthora cactorum]KAG3117531.1 hypothetical protein C6341_g27534 [Phytophthora cactorum]KAG3178028.1 hypothetical protein PC128_g16611 [Phytophthora cactorum]